MGIELLAFINYTSEELLSKKRNVNELRIIKINQRNNEGRKERKKKLIKNRKWS